jgi:hypothetical protein
MKCWRSQLCWGAACLESVAIALPVIDSLRQCFSIQLRKAVATIS